MTIRNGADISTPVYPQNIMDDQNIITLTGPSNNLSNNSNSKTLITSLGVPTGNSQTQCIVRIKKKYLHLFVNNLEKISVIFGVKLNELTSNCSGNRLFDDLMLSSGGTNYVYYQIIGFVQPQHGITGDTLTGTLNSTTSFSSVLNTSASYNDIDLCETTKRVQYFIDTLSVTEAEDSSYDSDCDLDDLTHLQILTTTTSNTTNHQNVSRTTSDTLGQEFAEYVTQQQHQQQQQQQSLASPTTTGAAAVTTLLVERSPGYTQRVEFALKLGYTERLVQCALARLGPNPQQNELLAELIKLGAQHGNKGQEFSCDLAQHSDCLIATTTGQQQHQQQQSTVCGVFNINEQNFQYDDTIISGLRPIVIDGSNVAMSHGNKEVFSCRGIKLCVDWFKNRGHKEITVFVPKWRKESSRPDNPIKDQDILNELERERLLVFTPSRLVGGKRMVCYDDRYILKLAAENDGIVVSNDNYRDLVQESTEFKKVVEERVLMYSFVNDRFMPPDDPLGRSGPTLDNFLRIQPRKGDPPPPCPYGKKCTYGNKCKFHHPERGTGPHKTVIERLSEHAARHLSARNIDNCQRTPVQGKSLSVPLSSSGETSPIGGNCDRRKPLSRTRSSVPECSSQTFVGGNCGIEKQQQQQQQQQQQMQHPYITSPQGQQMSGWDPSTHHRIDSSGFPKSHSIENISRDYNAMLPNNYCGIWTRQQAPPQQQDNIDPNNSGGGDGVNLHRKLQRQLTLNPAGCDPRIYQMQRVGCQQPPPPQQQQSQLSPHRPLAPSLSGPRNHPSSQWADLHQNVTRIASAPDPARPWHGGPPPASTSEPHINLWPLTQHNRNTLTPQSSHPPIADQRRRLHYHLASIFPEDQVQTVMQRYPDETNPQKICAAILNMFNKM